MYPRTHHPHKNLERLDVSQPTYKFSGTVDEQCRIHNPPVESELESDEEKEQLTTEQQVEEALQNLSSE